MNTAEDLEKSVSDWKLPDKPPWRPTWHRQPQETGVYLPCRDVGLHLAYIGTPVVGYHDDGYYELIVMWVATGTGRKQAHACLVPCKGRTKTRTTTTILQ